MSCFSLDIINFDLISYTAAYVNLALNQPAYQSSTKLMGLASLAVDGNVDTFSGQSCTLTSISTSAPWWSVDLGLQTYVVAVDLVNRGNSTDGQWLSDATKHIEESYVMTSCKNLPAA
jgi:hypothetical protein